MTKPPKPGAKEESRWRTIERVVALLEATLDPNATVEHDVELPDLLTPGVARQCDVVVTSGPPQRRTRTIVEVQRRKKKVDVLHFDGWVAKMRAVGAQHLICVSMAGFPESITSKAAQHGPTIRLVTLKELERESSLLQGALGTVHLRQAGTKEFRSVEVLLDDLGKRPAATPEGRQHEPVFRGADGELLSLNQIAQVALNRDPRTDGLSEGTHVLTLETQERFTFIADSSGIGFRLRFAVEVAVHRGQLDCEVLEYVQSPADGPLAWALLGEIARPDGPGCYQIKVTFRPAPDGRLRPGSISVTGLEPGALWTAVVAGHRAGPIRAP